MYHEYTLAALSGQEVIYEPDPLTGDNVQVTKEGRILNR